jgi:hypothetical protein
MFGGLKLSHLLFVFKTNPALQTLQLEFAAVPSENMQFSVLTVLHPAKVNSLKA